MASLQFVFWYWWVLAMLLLAIEMLAPGFFFMWMAVAGFVTGCVLLLFPAASIATQVFIFSLLSVSSIVFWKVLVKRKQTVSDHPLLNQRAAQYIGRTFTLIEPISNGQGKVRVGDSIWKVQGEDCQDKATVKVIAVEGTKLIVERV